MSSPVKVDEELLENLDFLISMDLLEKESDWDALGVDGALEATDVDLEDGEPAEESAGEPVSGEGS